MPSVNTKGKIAHGAFGAGACLDNVEFAGAPSGGACWYNPNTIIYQQGGVAYIEPPPPTGGPAGGYCALGFSFFWLMAGLRYWPAQVETNLNWIATNLKPDYARVMAVVGGVLFSGNDPWQYAGSYLSWPDHGSLLERATDVLFDKGIKIEWTLLGGLGQGMNVAQAQDDMVRYFAGHMAGRFHKIQLVEMMNEYTVNGGNTTMLRRMAAVARPLLGDIPISLSTPNPGNICTGGSTLTSEVTSMYAGQTAANAITPHWCRSNHIAPVLGASAPSLVYSNEPRGPGSSGVSTTTPSVIAGDYQAAINAGYAGYVYHTDWGIWDAHLQESFVDAVKGIWTDISEIPNSLAIATALRNVKDGQTASAMLFDLSPPSTPYLSLYNTDTHAFSVADVKGATVLFGSKTGHWAAWQEGVGLYSSPSVGLTKPAAALLGIGPEGSVAFRPEVNGTGLRVYQTRTGTEYDVTSAYAADVVVADEGQILWREGTALKTMGLPAAQVLGGVSSPPKLTLVKGKWWVGYQSISHGMVLHPLDKTTGYLMPGSVFFDITTLDSNPSVIRWAYSSTHSERAGNISHVDINVDTAAPTLGPGITVPGVPPPPPVPGATATEEITLISTNTFNVIAATEELVTLPIEVFPAYPAESGHGRLVHPTLGSFDYEVKPDEWMNIDAEAIVPPIWASSRTLTSAANVLWNGNIRDVVVEERWKALGGLAMPATQLRMLMAIWTTPIDPDVGYVQWHPNYITGVVFKVLPVNLTAGSNGITFDDVVNYKDENGDPIGWITSPVTLTLKIVERV